MTVADAKKAFIEWCNMNGYRISQYKKKGKKIDLDVESYVTELDEYERASLVEGVLIGMHAMFGIQVEPDVRVRENADIPKPHERERTPGGLLDRGMRR